MKKLMFLLKLFVSALHRKGLIYSLNRTWFHCRNYAFRLLSEKKIRTSFQFQAFRHDPLVSVVIVNFNSSNYISDFVKTLREQTYGHFEVIIVDNGSTDNSLQTIKNLALDLNLSIINNTNTGFASGCNIGAHAAKGEFLVFVNCDTLLDKYWLKGLVDGFRFDRTVAAVTSKTLFLEDFFDLEIDYYAEFKFDLATLEDSLTYSKYFVRTSFDYAGNDIFCNSKLIISIPASTKQLKLRFKFIHHGNHSIRVRIGRQKELLLHCQSEDHSFTIELPKIFDSTPIINNAGSDIRGDDHPFDRGYGEYDRGQYDNPEYVRRFCGCSFAIRQTAITRRPPFLPQFFAYYEDSELSRFIVDSGHRILYNPRSVLRHYHSASSGEHSLFRKYLVNRSFSIYSRTFSQSARELRLRQLYKEYFGTIPLELQPLFEKYDDQIVSSIGDLERQQRGSRAIAIYNSFWNTYGGGEIHALNVARDFIQKDDKVFLLSEVDFDLENLFSYFGSKPFQAYKSIGEIDSEFTAKFDVFINSTYCSNLISKAKESFYIVSFPHQHVEVGFLNNYHFLFNSPYTEAWAKKYWGDVRGNLRLPLDLIQISNASVTQPKEKIFVVVGRYCTKGHRKMQLEIVQAFQDATKTTGLRDWKLILLGSLDKRDNDAQAYFERIKDLVSDDESLEVYSNVDRSQIQESYAKAAYVISATGLGEPLDQPELFEHFGIAVLEGLSFGCAPIVHKIGGPAFLAELAGHARFFSTTPELISCLEDAMNSPLPDSPGVRANIMDFIEQQQRANSDYTKRLVSNKAITHIMASKEQ